MNKEQSVGAILFYLKGDLPHYLLLKYPSSQYITTAEGSAVPEYWEFPKGHVEEGEEELDTLGREIREETGITDIELHKPFREEIAYHFKRGDTMVYKHVIFYLAQVQNQSVSVSHEHLGFKWLPYSQAHVLTPFEKSKEVLQKANEFVEHRLLKN